MDESCPYCGAGMLDGYLNTDRCIWSERMHTARLAPDRKEKFALFLRPAILHPHYIPAKLCPQCGKMIVDTSGYECRLH